VFLFSCGFKIEVAGDARSLGQLVIAAVQHDFFAGASRLALAGARSMRMAVEGVTTELVS
jgi:hypothetical protein